MIALDLRSDDWLQFWNNKADRKDRLVAVSYVMGFFDAFRGLGMVCRAPVSYESLASVTADIIRTTEEKELMIAVALAHERLGCRFPGKGGAK